VNSILNAEFGLNAPSDGFGASLIGGIGYDYNVGGELLLFGRIAVGVDFRHHFMHQGKIEKNSPFKNLILPPGSYTWHINLKEYYFKIFQKLNSSSWFFIKVGPIHGRVQLSDDQYSGGTKKHWGANLGGGMMFARHQRFFLVAEGSWSYLGVSNHVLRIAGPSRFASSLNWIDFRIGIAYLIG
jgi:hypothetical protein